ncbi:MAG: gliding motility-associated C-terminal domain-containing protein [Bacteroidota bacterium]
MILFDTVVILKKKYENIFPNIDIVFKANKKVIKYDVILNPGAGISDVKLKYNRWGQLLYEGGTGTDPWDGTYNGKPVPTGSYIYVIKPFRGLDDIVGIVTVVM